MCTIAIDTCVFEHLMNPAWNADAHIDSLLGLLRSRSYRLLVDETSKIAGEYATRIVPIIRNNAEERAAVLPLLRHWMSPDIRESITVGRNDALTLHIRGVITEQNEVVDRLFVYVACRKGTHLVSNDSQHILDRAPALLRRPKGFREGSAQIQSSRDAAAYFSAAGGQE